MKASALQTKSFSKEAALGGTRTHDTLLTRQSTLPTELPGQLSRQDSKSTRQHKVKPQITVCMVTQKKPYTTLHIIVIDNTLIVWCMLINISSQTDISYIGFHNSILRSLFTELPSATL